MERSVKDESGSEHSLLGVGRPLHSTPLRLRNHLDFFLAFGGDFVHREGIAGLGGNHGVA